MKLVIYITKWHLHYKMADSTAICMTVNKAATRLSCNTNE